MKVTASSNNDFELTLPATFEEIDLVCQKVRDFLEEHGLTALSFDILLGVREALTNAIRHGNKEDATKEVQFGLRLEEGELRLTVQDQGPGFDWHKTMQACSLNLSESGRGICILSQYFDEVRFNRSGNILELRKKIHTEIE